VNQILGFIIGLSGGLLGGLVGVGGGIIMIPLMTRLAKLTQHQAHGTSLVAIVFTGLAGAGTYSLHGSVDWQAALLLTATAVITARYGALYAHSLPEKKLKKAFGFFLIIASLLLLTKSSILGIVHRPSWWVKAAAYLFSGALTGFISGMMGVGGAGVMIPLMVLLAGMEQHLAQGTSLLVMVPAGMTGALTHYRLGNVQTKIVWGMVIGGLAGGYLGATTANLLPGLTLTLIFSGIGIWMGIHYIKA
jgi:uncharacterized membrane protein YfcA